MVAIVCVVVVPLLTMAFFLFGACGTEEEWWWYWSGDWWLYVEERAGVWKCTRTGATWCRSDVVNKKIIELQQVGQLPHELKSSIAGYVA